MPHSYVSNLMHCIFSTKERIHFIDPELESRLWPYIGGIARANKMRAVAIGGTTDHLHTLLSLPATMDVAKAVQLIKGGSSKWVHDKFTEHRQFAWRGRVWGLQCERVTSGEDHRLHQCTEGTSPKANV
jgi:putative transposase